MLRSSTEEGLSQITAYSACCCGLLRDDRVCAHFEWQHTAFTGKVFGTMKGLDVFVVIMERHHDACSCMPHLPC